MFVDQGFELPERLDGAADRFFADSPFRKDFLSQPHRFPDALNDPGFQIRIDFADDQANGVGADIDRGKRCHRFFDSSENTCCRTANAEFSSETAKATASWGPVFSSQLNIPGWEWFRARTIMLTL